MRNVRLLVALAVAGSLRLPAAMILDPPVGGFTQQAFTAKCGNTDCAKVTLAYYGTLVTDVNPQASNQVKGGAVLAMAVQPLVQAEFHWIQAVVLDTQPPMYILEPTFTIPTPFVDPPPLGYVGQKFDALPWYDEKPEEVTKYNDAPSFARGALEKQTGMSGAVSFETWLVCVISTDIQGLPNIGPAKQNKVTVAPLFGLTWGFETTYDPTQDPANKDSVKNMSVKLQAINIPLASPSSAWKDALKQTYGTKLPQEFSVTLGDCTECVKITTPIPEPSSVWMGALALGSLIRRTVMRRRKVYLTKKHSQAAGSSRAS